MGLRISSPGFSDALRAIDGFDAAFVVYATEIDLGIRLARPRLGNVLLPGCCVQPH
jgi:GT2 family glycosyltransferase